MSMLENIQSPEDLRKLTVEDLPEVASEIRRAIIEQVSRSGGHLAPNLGVVELTIALHYVFDFSHDRLLFDVGHQCYPHKLLTGRLGLLDKLRTREGMSGFPAPSESEYDLFSVGHAGTAISTGVGMARADSLKGEAFHAKANPSGRRVVALIGDGSIANGVAMEGLNSAGTLRRQMLIVLNDNGMSISRPQGALAQYFDRLRLSHIYGDIKKGARRILRHVPGGGLVEDVYHKFGDATKAMVAENSWFEHFGLVTVGPIDGHNIPSLIEFLGEAREFDRPMVLHVKTVKGKGLEIAEADATRFHSPAAFTYEREGVHVEGKDAKTACRIEVRSAGRSFTSAFGDALVDLMERDDKVVTCTAAMPDGTGVVKALERYPDRAWDAGICESHAMDMMGGLAHGGFKPYFAVYSTFFQRAFDQAFQDVALQGLGVRLCLDRAGLVGGDGAVHQGFCDVALLRTLPRAVVMAAMDEASLRAGLEFMRGLDDRISAIRYPRDDVDHRFAEDLCPAFELGKARYLSEAVDQGEIEVAVLGFGPCALTALDAAKDLGDEVRVGVWDARFAKPVDDELIARLLGRGVAIVTVEEHAPAGGFGDAVIDSANRQRLDTGGVSITKLTMPDAWIHQDSRQRQLHEAGLDREGIGAAIRRVLESGVLERRRAAAGKD